jgi:hypothetical protein
MSVVLKSSRLLALSGMLLIAFNEAELGSLVEESWFDRVKQVDYELNERKTANKQRSLCLLGRSVPSRHTNVERHPNLHF